MSKLKKKEPEVAGEKKVVKYTLISLFLIFLAGFNYFILSDMLGSNDTYINNFEVEKKDNENAREPAVAGIFYASDRTKLDETIRHYLRTDDNAEIQPKILIVPHAGYKYSGAVAGKAYGVLKKFEKEIKRVVVVGPSHYVNLYGAALPSYDSFKTPFGRVKINQKAVANLAKESNFKVFNAAHKKEHSIEVQIPFLQKALSSFTIVPVVYGEISPEELASGLEYYMKRKDTVIIFSADLSHYYTYEKAQDLDGFTNNLVLNKEAQVVDELSCGATGINAALLLAKEYSLYPQTIEMQNSGDVTGDKNQVVGYGAWSFSFSEPKVEIVQKTLESEYQSLVNFAGLYRGELLSIAKIALEDAVLRNEKYAPSRKDYSDALFNKGASFVTLYKKDELRGCVGTIIPYQAIARDVSASTYQAAMQDERFEKVSSAELNNLSLSVSLLTNLEQIRYINEEDLLEKIEQGIDGIVIREGDRQGLFLPSVWREFKTKREFLNALKLKTGLSPSYWSNRIKVYRFKTVEIKENEN
ncbi:MAG: AmmeMemoRadiSam system protein B [Alphaproteobacteria bacterium]|nr:AmmeMemoRadiSam system protein B [Alphaproteobacteria bacterium]